MLRLGRYLLITEDRLAAAERFFTRHGNLVVPVARFIEGLRQVNGIVAGVARMWWWRFLAYNTLGSIAWVGLWVLVGYLAGNHITTIYQDFQRYEKYVLTACAVIVVALVMRWLLRRRQQHHAAANVTAAEDIPLEVSHHRINANGLDQHCVIAGDGPAVVLLHGFPEFWCAWHHQIQSRQGITVIGPDLHGQGYTEKAHTAMTNGRWPPTSTSCWRRWAMTELRLAVRDDGRQPG